MYDLMRGYYIENSGRSIYQKSESKLGLDLRPLLKLAKTVKATLQIKRSIGQGAQHRLSSYGCAQQPYPSLERCWQALG